MTDDRKPTEEERLKAIWGSNPPNVADGGGTLIEAWDTLVWDERRDWCEFWEWPTHHRRARHFSRACSPGSFHQFALSDLFHHGWEVVSCVPVRCGFLWLDQSRVWTMRRKVTWRRVGTETSYVGTRETPRMPDQPHEDDDGYPW